MHEARSGGRPSFRVRPPDAACREKQGVVLLQRALAGIGLVLGMLACPPALCAAVPASSGEAASPAATPEQESADGAHAGVSVPGLDNVLGEPRVTRRVTRIHGGETTIRPPTISVPTVRMPQVETPRVASPTPPRVVQPEPEPTGKAAAVAVQEWRQLEPGLEYREFPFIATRYEMPSGEEHPPRATLRVVRIDPARFEFVLCAASDGGVPLPLGRWADHAQLVAAINASMYLPDGRTSTGYLRDGGHVNNARHGGRLGAYFLAGPDGLARAAGAPRAAVEDGTRVNMDVLEGHYRLVAQNFRMISADRRIVWAADSRPVAIAAVAQTGDGHILFLHCRQPVEPYVLAQRLLNLPLDVRTVMYVEGGAQAGLLLRSGGLLMELYGRSAAAILLGEPPAPSLPNVLGIRRRQSAAD